MGFRLPKGFKANGLNCGIKKRKKDLALIYSDSSCNAAALFTTNRFKAAPVEISIRNLKNRRAQAVIINSGNANCATGSQGYKDALTVNRHIAGALDIPQRDAVVASTGVIGKRLDVRKLIAAIPQLVKGLNGDSAKAAATAMMTTDTFPKLASVSMKISGKPVRICGMAKGAGMISPNMATMLSLFMTDACIAKNGLHSAFKKAAGETFNSISVDGDMSTNDMAVILANGKAGNKPIKSGGSDYMKFYNGLYDVASRLARMIVADGEGATKQVKVEVSGAVNATDAERAARQVAQSPLFKTMIYGAHPNPGRIVAALGASGTGIGKKGASIYLCGVPVFKKDRILNYSKTSLTRRLKKKRVDVRIVLNNGRYSKTIYTCDLTPKYIAINKGYS